MNILKMMLVVVGLMVAVSAYSIPLKPEVKMVKITYESVPSGATVVNEHGVIVGTTPITAHYPVSSKALIYGGFYIMIPSIYWGDNDFKVSSAFFIDFKEMSFEFKYTIVSPLFNKEKIKGI